MRGVSNAISAVFVIAIILSITYVALSASISNIRAVAAAEKKISDHQILRSQIRFGPAFVDGNTIKLEYAGVAGEYAIRLFCTDAKTHSKYCIAPTYGGKTAVSYWDPSYETNMEFHVDQCPDELWKDLNTDGLLCYIIGEDSDELRFIKG